MARGSGGVKPPFSVLGHHSTLYNITLPPIIPEDVQQEMVIYFRAYLCNQLWQLALPAIGVRTHQTTQSSSCASVASSVTKRGKQQGVFANSKSDNDNEGDHDSEGDDNDDDSDDADSDDANSDNTEAVGHDNAQI